MKDKYGKTIKAGSWLLCVNDTNHCGETVQVEVSCGTLCVPDCNGVSCELPLSEFADENGVLYDYIVIDDPTKRYGYVRSAEVWKDLDLNNIGRRRVVSPEDLTLEQIARLRMLGYDNLYPDDSGEVVIDEADIFLADADDNTYDPERMFYEDDPDFYGEDLEIRLHQFIRPSNHYLVFAYGVRWDGASGYLFADSMVNAIRRDYETSIYPTTATAGGKTLLCKEYSHDVPTGSLTAIIALTDAEYDRLSQSDFDAVRHFAKNCVDTAENNHKR